MTSRNQCFGESGVCHVPRLSGIRPPLLRQSATPVVVMFHSAMVPPLLVCNEPNAEEFTRCTTAEHNDRLRVASPVSWYSLYYIQRGNCLRIGEVLYRTRTQVCVHVTLFVCVNVCSSWYFLRSPIAWSLSRTATTAKKRKKISPRFVFRDWL